MPEPSGRRLKAVEVQVEQDYFGDGAGKGAVVEEIAGSNADIQVAAGYMAVIELDRQAGRAAPGESAGKAQD